MALMTSSQPSKALKLFNLKLYKIRARPLNFLFQNLGSFTTPPRLQQKKEEEEGKKGVRELTVGD